MIGSESTSDRQLGATAADRGVSELVGFLLVVAVLVVLLAVLQATAVPAWNLGVEHDHNQEIQGDAIDLRSAVIAAAGSGNERSASVRLGTEYPSRAVFLNPTPASGTLETTAEEPITIRNVEPVGHENTRLFWADVAEGEGRELPTRQLRYRPNYNEYDTAPTTILEHGTLYNRFPGDENPVDVVRANRDVVDDDRITLIGLDGDFDEDGIERTSVDATPASAPTRRLAVASSDDGPIEIELPTDLTEETWEELLADELADGNVESLAVSDGRLQLALDGDRRYQLRLARIGLGDGIAHEDPAYIVTERRSTVAPGEEFVVQVRDRFNNPVSGARVGVEPSEESGVDMSTCTFAERPTTTDENGRIVGSCTDEGTLEFELLTEREPGDPIPSYETVNVSVGDPETVDVTEPSIDDTDVTSRTEDFQVPAGQGQQTESRTLSQVTVDYDVSDDGTGVARVAIELWDDDPTADGRQVTATTHTYEEPGPHDGQWVSPWIDATAAEIDDYHVVVRATDRSGNVAGCSTSVAANDCQ